MTSSASAAVCAVERRERGAEGTEHQVALALELGLQPRELAVELVPHPKRPVT